jgi:hypothetical protein
VRAPNVPLAWYARHMRRAVHGDEISTVTVRPPGPAILDAIRADIAAGPCGWRCGSN